jgi:histidine ammonia-lyase
MAPNAARRLVAIADNVANIVGIELLAAAQGLDFQRPLTSSAPVEAAFALIRARVPRLHEDRLLAPDIAAAAALVREGAFDDLVPMAME